MSKNSALDSIKQHIDATAVQLKSSVDFFLLVSDILSQLKSIGLSFTTFSVYLFDHEANLCRHYSLSDPAAGWEDHFLTENKDWFHAHLTGQVQMWRDLSSEASLWYLVVPSRLGAVEISDYREGEFSSTAQEILEQVAPSLEMLAVRHRDLHALEMAQGRVLEIDADLLALYDGSYDLSGTTHDEVAQKIIRTVITRLSFDRAGIFLRTNEVLHGICGVDEKGEIIPITDTVFPLYPEDSAEISEAALIARGKLAYHLTQNLDGEGGESDEGDIEANVSVPMRMGNRIVGVLAADNYFSGEPITPVQVQPLMILANQGAVALENARLYQELRSAYEHLWELQNSLAEGEELRVLGELVAIIAHEIRNPLGAIKNCLAVLRRLPKIPDQYREMIDLTDTETGHLNKLVENLLVYSKAEVPQLSSVDLVALTREIVRLVQQDADFLQKVEIICEGPDDPIPCRGDRTQLRQVILNLTVNAVEACAPEGQVVLAVEIGSRQHRIVVRDTGCGMSTEVQERLFEPFFSAKSRGTGLGLTVVQRIVEAHKGSIEIASVPDEGTTVTVILPDGTGHGQDSGR